MTTLVRLALLWRCRHCDAHGDGPTSDTDAERHTTQASHATHSGATPQGTAGHRQKGED